MREGPSAGTTLRGHLVIAAIDEVGTELRGVLMTRDGQYVAVTGARGDDELELSFRLEGGIVHGHGALGADGELCIDGLEGTLEGPAQGDRGDWLGAELLAYGDPMATYDVGLEGDSDISNNGTSDDEFFETTSTEQISPSCSRKVTRNNHGTITSDEVTCRSGNITCTYSYHGDQVLLQVCKDGSGRPVSYQYFGD